MMFEMYGYPYSYGMGVGFIFMILFWAVIIWLIIVGIRYARHQGWQRYPLDTLKERYAKGEISKKEFEQIKKELK